MVTKIRSLFPGYMFAEITAATVDAVKELDGVRGFVMDGERRWADDGKVVASLREREDSEGFVRLPEAPPRYSPGSAVMVERGVMGGHVGKVTRSGVDCVDVIFEMLGVEVCKTIDADDVHEIKDQSDRQRRRRRYARHVR
jgi:transcription antitermination factor NusG